MSSIDSSSLADLLEPLRWRRLRLVLRNRRNVFAKEPPYFVVHAILKGACSRAGLKESCDFFFHPVGEALSERVTKGSIYTVDVIFPLATRVEVERFARGTEEQLTAKPNFELAEPWRVEDRSLACIEREQATLIEIASDEVCLDFLTPLHFTPADPERPWMVSASALARLCSLHLAFLYTHLPWPLPEPGVPALRTLPYYWDAVKGVLHRSKSQRGSKQPLRGYMGPLYLRGDWRQIAPLLLVCSELHAGYGKGDEHALHAQRMNRHRIASGEGAFALRSTRPWLDPMIRDQKKYIAICKELSDESAVADELRQTFDGGERLAREVAQAVAAGLYEPEPARLFDIPKKDGSDRALSMLHARDAIVHRVLLDAVAVPFDRMFESASVAYRPRRSVKTARAMLRKEVNQGAEYVVSADVEDFFDEIEWETLERALDAVLPRGDILARHALSACIRMPVRRDGRRVSRTRGILQGSPLSPLLANLYLDTFDEQMAARGHALIRYGDDFVIPARTSEDAGRALDDANAILQPLGLSLSKDKTAITPLDLGFSFLGMELPAEMDEELVERSALKKALFIKRPHAFTAIDDSSVVVKSGTNLVARLPLHRIGEIVFLGDGAVSQRLLQRCAKDRIPVSFCSPAGWYCGTFRPDSRSWFARIARHQVRHDALGERGCLAVAKNIVTAKLVNYGAWLSSLPGSQARRVSGVVETIRRELAGAESIESVRGYEGSAARVVFAEINRRTPQPGFRSQGRLPREKPDRFNALLDFLYSMLFTRLNVLVRGEGLNPYLGFLHSARDDYESLVCDMQEPFRCRMDRLALKLINRREIVEGSFDEKDGRWRLNPKATGVLIEAFEREEQVRLAREAATLGELLSAQVLALRRWVEGDDETPALFVSRTRQSRSDRAS